MSTASAVIQVDSERDRATPWAREDLFCCTELRDRRSTVKGDGGRRKGGGRVREVVEEDEEEKEEGGRGRGEGRRRRRRRRRKRRRREVY